MAIQVLTPDVVSKIAAGEVIERPASIVKELVENSLDAGASQITVEVSGGGTQLIKVADNGSGILRDEVEVAFERHATSKIASDSDLEAIASLGFRGEALPSIAAVTDMSVITRHQNDEAGTVINLRNGVIIAKDKVGCPVGTAISVRDLFRNVPARLKFLKSSSTENGHISYLVTQYMLAFPEVRFNLLINGRTIMQSPGNGNLRDALVEAYGLETAKAMLEVGTTDTDPSAYPLSGYISPSSISRSNRNYLSFFVNRRWVQNRTLAYAVEEAYRGMLMTGKHPIATINITLLPQEIDINVHPTKREIRFRREGDLFVAVQKAVRDTLVGFVPLPGFRPAPSLPNTTSPGFHAPLDYPKADAQTSGPLLHREKQSGQSHGQLPILRVVGQFRNTYIIAESPDGLFLIDQHAGHERILFEQVLSQRATKAIEVQGLLEPMVFEVTARQAELLRSRSGVLSENGFTMEQFGERVYLLRSVPALLKKQDIIPVLIEILEFLSGTQGADWQEAIATSLACHGAVRAGQTLTFPEMEELIRQLEQTQLPYTCPHGRPTTIHVSASRVEKEFGRR